MEYGDGFSSSEAIVDDMISNYNMPSEIKNYFINANPLPSESTTEV